MEYTMHTAFVVPNHVGKLGIPSDDNYCAFDRDPETGTWCVQVSPEVWCKLPAIVCFEMYILTKCYQFREDSAHTQEMFTVGGGDGERACEAVVDGQTVKHEVAHALSLSRFFVRDSMLRFYSSLDPVQEDLRCCCGRLELVVRWWIRFVRHG